MHLLYKNVYILSALNTLFIEICTYSIKVIPEILNTYISHFEHISFEKLS